MQSIKNILLMQKYQKIIFDNNKILVIAHMNNVDSED
jgi:hypothetical protein